MANHLKGEVAVAVLGKDLIFRLGINEMLELQSALGLVDKDEEFLANFDNFRNLTVIRKIALFGFKRHQPEMTEAEAGDIVTELGLESMAKIRREALRWALPDQEPPKEGGKPRPSAGPTPS